MYKSAGLTLSAARAPLPLYRLPARLPERRRRALRLGGGGGAVLQRELEELRAVGRRAARAVARAQPRALRADGGGDAVLDGARVAARLLEHDGRDQSLERLLRLGLGLGLGLGWGLG